MNIPKLPTYRWDERRVEGIFRKSEQYASLSHSWVPDQ